MMRIWKVDAVEPLGSSIDWNVGDPLRLPGDASQLMLTADGDELEFLISALLRGYSSIATPRRVVGHGSWARGLTFVASVDDAAYRLLGPGQIREYDPIWLGDFGVGDEPPRVIIQRFRYLAPEEL